MKLSKLLKVWTTHKLEWNYPAFQLLNSLNSWTSVIKVCNYWLLIEYKKIYNEFFWTVSKNIGNIKNCNEFRRLLNFCWLRGNIIHCNVVLQLVEVLHIINWSEDFQLLNVLLYIIFRYSIHFNGILLCCIAHPKLYLI
jgi:hypothetical protein